MTAAGRITATKITPGTVLIVERAPSGVLLPTTRKRGVTVTVTGKDLVGPGEYGTQRRYVIHTDGGTIAPAPGAQTFTLATVPALAAPAVDQVATVPAASVDQAPAVPSDPSALWFAYQQARTADEEADGPAPVRLDVKPRRETFRGRCLVVQRGTEWGSLVCTVNGYPASTLTGSGADAMDRAAVMLRRDVVGADERNVTDPDAYPAEWFKGSTWSPSPAVVAYLRHRADQDAADRANTCPSPTYHVSGEIGCPLVVRNCNGVPADPDNVTAAAIADPPVTGFGEVGRLILATVRRMMPDTADVVTAGESDPYGYGKVRRVTTWGMIVPGHGVTVACYEGRPAPGTDSVSLAAVFIDGRMVDGAGAIPMAQQSAALAGRIGWEIVSAVRALASDTDQAPAGTVSGPTGVDVDGVRVATTRRIDITAPAVESDATAPAPAVLVDTAPESVPAASVDQAAAGTVPTVEHIPAGLPYVVSMPADWPTAPVRIEGKDVATMIRKKVLPVWFPGIKFSVRTATGSMYLAVDVSWSDGPADCVVDMVTAMFRGKFFNGQDDSTSYRGPVLFVDADGTATAYNLPGVSVSTHRDVTAGGTDQARPFLPAGVGDSDQVPADWSDPFGRDWYGGDAIQCARWMARNGVDRWTRASMVDNQPACPVERCALVAGHPYAPIHRNHYGRAFFDTIPGNGNGGNGGTEPTDTPTDPAPMPAAPSFRTWEELTAWILAGRPAVTAPAAESDATAPTPDAPTVDQVGAVPVTGDPVAGGPFRLRTLPPGANPNHSPHMSPGAWRDGESFADRNDAMITAYRMAAGRHVHGVKVRDGAGDTVAAWAAGTDIWSPWGRHGVDYGTGADWIGQARAAYDAEVHAIVAGAASTDGTDRHTWQVVTFDASTARAALGKTFGDPDTAEREASQITNRPFNYTVSAFLVRVHAAATAVYGEAGAEPLAVFPHDVAPAAPAVDQAPTVGTPDVDQAPAAPVDVPAAPAEFLLSVTNDARGNIRVHRRGCADVARDVRGGGVDWDESSPDLRAVVTNLYGADFEGFTPAAWSDFAGDITVMPCAGTLPDEAGPLADQAPAPVAVPAPAGPRWMPGTRPKVGDLVHVFALHDTAYERVERVDVLAEVVTRLGCGCYRITATRPGPFVQGAPPRVDLHTGCGFHEAHVGDPATARPAADILDQAAAHGRREYAEGLTPAAPAMCPEIMAMVAGYPVGTGAAEIFRAFTRGHAEAAEAAARHALLASEISQQGAEAARLVADRNPEAEECAAIAAAGAASAAVNLATRTAEAEAARTLAETAAPAAVPAVPALAAGGADQGDDDGDAPAVYTLPAEVYTVELASDPDADLTITHDHENGTHLDGGAKGDGTLEIVNTYRFIWRRGAGVHIPASRDRFADLVSIDKAATALRAAGWSVAIEIDDVWRPASVREGHRAERASARAERLGARAVRQFGEADTRRATAQRMGDGMPFGEPIKVGHHSERRHRAAFDKIERNTRASINAWDYAQSLASRAAGSQANERAKHDPRAIMRRIERLEADARSWGRELADVATGDGRRRRALLESEMIAEDIAYQRAKLGTLAESGEFVAWSGEHFAKGDRANVGGRWCVVTRINPKGVSVQNRYEWEKGGRSTAVKWDEIHGRRRGDMQWDTPNGEPRSVVDAQRAATWANLLRSLSVSYDRSDTAAVLERARVQHARRVVLGLAKTATAQEVDAFGEPDTLDGKRARALAMLAAYERLTAGETFDQVAADTVPIADTVPAWTMPAGEPVDVLPADLVAGDIVAGVWDNFAGSRRVATHMVGPVTAAPKPYDRRESGSWVTVQVAGEDHELRSFRWLLVHRTGAR